jgi:hypothetical protein
MVARRRSGKDERATLPVEPYVADAIERIRRASAQPLRSAFLARGLTGLARIAAEMDEQALGTAVSAPSDYAVLLECAASSGSHRGNAAGRSTR